MKKHFIDISCDADIVDKVALNKKAREIYEKVHSRSEAETLAVLEKRRALSAIGGVAELDSLEGEYYKLNIYRDSPMLDFVEMRDLPLGSVPFYRTRYVTPIAFYTGSVNAMGSTIRYATNDAAIQVFPFTVTTDEVEVPNLNAIYDMARLGQRTAALERLAHDMQIALVNINLNTLLRSTANGGVSVITDDPATSIVNYFNGGGSFSGKNVYVLDPGVQSTAVPTTNVIDLHTENGLTKAVFQAINDFRLLAKRNIRKIYVPSANTGSYPVWRAMQDQASVVSIVSGTGNNLPSRAVPEDFWDKFQADDFSGTVTVNWFGLNVDIEVQNWLPAGYCLVLTDKPSSIMWDRLNLATGQDLAGTLEVPVNGYTSRRSEARQIATVSPDFCLLNFLVIRVQ